MNSTRTTDKLFTGGGSLKMRLRLEQRILFQTQAGYVFPEKITRSAPV